MSDSAPIVISAPRSGLNFVRLCIEASLSLRTPGETLLISREDQPDPAFLRTHDAAGVLGKENQGVWRVITQNKAESAKVVLLLRNPLDVFGRAKATGRPSSSLRVFCHNINQFVKIKPKDKRCFYFEDFISAPKKMSEIIRFSLPKYCESTEEIRSVLSEKWEYLQSTGKFLYDKDQAHAGGAMSHKSASKKHRQNLSEDDVQEFYRILETHLSVGGARYLRRYNLFAHI